MLRRLVEELLGSRAVRVGVHEPDAAGLAQAYELLRARDYVAALAVCEEIIAREPTTADPWELMGAIALERGEHELACVRFEKALEFAGVRLQTLCNAAEANRQAGRHARALELCERALAQDPEHAPALHIKALALRSCWRMQDALDIYRRLAQRRPDAAPAYAAYLFLLVLLGEDPLRVRAEHVRCAQLHPAPGPESSAANPAHPLRRLRIGYVSADFRDHAASNFVEPILEHHNRAEFEVYCYSSTEMIDDTTRRLRRLAAHWRDVRWLDDAAMARRVRSDAIDILVDLSGYTSGNRLPVFARKPAPVQITYLGYPATTGMSAMDYRLTDGVADMPGIAEPWYTERLLRLPHSMWCFGPPSAMPELAPPPCQCTGGITFGSVNSLFKLTPRIIALWSQLLLSVPRASLLLATIPAGEARERIVAEFAKNGVAAAALDIHPPLERASFWDLHRKIDIALDTYPCNGGATTCELLWSGVPLVSMAGELFQSRAGASLLGALGLQQLVARSESEYLRIARELAFDRARLAQLRAKMRARMRASPLLDAAGFARDLEALYRAAWRDWCAGKAHV